MPIQILPTQLANQIAAGEVVERPASVVKELIENSLDSGATQVSIEIERGGHKRIRITDNGCGIAKHELALALSRHATSKISELQDLEQIVSLGFRGEALASVSSVSRLTITSKPAEQENAWQAIAEGRDMQVDIQPAAHPDGTSVDVADLFFNTPARRKFLRAEKTEFAHIDEVVRRIALSRFDVSFTLKHNGKAVRKYPVITGSSENPEEQLRRISAICGRTFSDSALYLDSQYQGNKLHGWIASPGHERTQNDLQYFYVHGRMMRDKLINHAVRQAFEGLIASDSFPAFVLYLQLPAQQVDVNVHPAKHEVRFHQSRLVHDFIFRSIADALGQALQTPEQTSESEHKSQETTHLPHVEPNHDYIQPLKNANVPKSLSESRSSYGGGSYKSGVSTRAAENYQALMRTDPQFPDKQTRDSLINVFPVEETWMLIDYEKRYFCIKASSLYLFKLQTEYLENKVVSQPLLMPVSLSSSAELKTLCTEIAPKLTDIGFELIHTHNKIILKQVPAGLRNLNWSGVLTQFFENIESTENVSSIQLVMLACIADEQTQQGARRVGSLMQLWSWFTATESWQTKLSELGASIPLSDWLGDRDAN